MEDSKKFKVILADPPWTFNVRSSRGENRSASNHYDCMSTADILGIGPMVADVAHKNAVMFLWATNSQLPEALDFMAACGFKYKSLLTWVKMTKDNTRPAIGTGYRFRNTTEQLLLGVKWDGVKEGKSWSPAPHQRKRGVILSPRGKHSAKPDEQWDFIEIYPGPYLELFARQERPGWVSLGNELGEGLDIRKSLPKLYNPQRSRRVAKRIMRKEDL